MQGKTCLTTKVQKGDGQLEQLIERGRQLHDQAVFYLFAWMVTLPVRSARQYFGNDRVKKRSAITAKDCFLKHTSKIPA